MDLMLPRLNALRDSEDEAAIAGAEYRHSTRLSGVGVSLKDGAKAPGMGVTVKDDANELGMDVIDSAGSAHVVMSSQDKVIVGYWLVRAAFNVALSRGANKNKLLRGTGIFEDALQH
ncbi:MAG: AraC family transcriptional regulator, partial [Pseudomonadota bacterium]|nr:AraC family transcriptional regulator [Pseudomonadota bacterium]